MVNYILATEEQRELAEDARKILEKELVPRIDELEHGDNGLGEFPRYLWKKNGGSKSAKRNGRWA